jgi:hypothetical protein
MEGIAVVAEEYSVAVLDHRTSSSIPAVILSH